MLCGLVACAAIPDAIDTDHPDRFQGDRRFSNPVHTLPDSKRFREAFAKLECLVVIDVAMTETAPSPLRVTCLLSILKPRSNVFRRRDALKLFLYASQFSNPGDTLPEAEIYSRLVEAMGEADGVEELAEAAKKPRSVYRDIHLLGSQTLAPNYPLRCTVLLDRASVVQRPYVRLSNASLNAFS